MKKQVFLGVLALASFASADAQQWNGSSTASNGVYRDGNVGIGLASSPNYHLVVSDPSSSSNGVQSVLGGTQILGFPASHPSTLSIMELQSRSHALLTVTSHVSGSALNTMWLGTNDAAHFLYCGASNATTKPFTFQVHDGTTLHFPITILPTGQVGIGTGITSFGTKALVVEGNIGCRDLEVVPPATGWPDYVFAADYGLMSLEEVESFIQKNNHLPLLPSAHDIEKQGSFKVGATQVQMLQALEELYLHVIQLKKENEQLRKEVSRLQNN